MSKKISDNLKEAKQSDAAERWKRVNLDQGHGRSQRSYDVWGEM